MKEGNDPVDVPTKQYSTAPQFSKLSRTLFVFGIIGCILLVLLVGTYAISRNFSLPGERLVHPDIKSTTLPASLTENTEKPVWHQPKWYLASGEKGDLILGNLADGAEVVVAESEGEVFGEPSLEAVAPSGKYFLYIQLPDDIISRYRQHPPYEYHGSSDYILHLVTISNGQVADKSIDTNVSALLGPTLFAFDKDERGIYYQKHEVKDVTYYYDIQSGQSVPKDPPGYLGINAVLSPSRTSYALLTPLPKVASDTGVNETLDLFHVSVDGKTRDSLTEFVSGEQSLIFPLEKTIFLAREDYVHGPNSTCFIERIDIGGVVSEVHQLEKRDCPPGFNNTNYHNLSLSPDGTHLVAEYTEQGPSSQEGTSTLLIYDLTTKEKKILASTKGLLGSYFWVSPNELLIGGGSPSLVRRVNIRTGEVTTESSFQNKSLLSVF